MLKYKFTFLGKKCAYMLGKYVPEQCNNNETNVNTYFNNKRQYLLKVFIKTVILFH